MSKFDRIATFLAVIEENGFAAAARKKEISTAAVSRQITALENELGGQLIKRSTRHIRLTEIGEEYYQQCKQALTKLSDAEMIITKSSHEATGTLRVMANRYFVITYLLPKLSEFMALNPNLHIDFQLAERSPNLEEEEIDILFGVSIEGADELIRRRVTTTRYVLCASPYYFKKHGTPKTPADLHKHSVITHSMRKPNNVIFLKNEQTIPIKPVLWLNDSYAMLECAINNMGIVNLHDYIVADALREGKLVEIFQEYQEPQKNIYLYYQQSRYLLPKIRKFIDFYISD